MSKPLTREEIERRRPLNDRYIARYIATIDVLTAEVVAWRQGMDSIDAVGNLAGEYGDSSDGWESRFAWAQTIKQARELTDASKILPS